MTIRGEETYVNAAAVRAGDLLNVAGIEVVATAVQTAKGQATIELKIGIDTGALVMPSVRGVHVVRPDPDSDAIEAVFFAIKDGDQAHEDYWRKRAKEAVRAVRTVEAQR